MPQFTQAFVQVLALADSQTVDCGLKMEALKVCSLFFKECEMKNGHLFQENCGGKIKYWSNLVQDPRGDHGGTYR